MFSRYKARSDEYELVEQRSDGNDLERQTNLEGVVEELERELNDTEGRNSGESATSQLFENLDSYAQKNDSGYFEGNVILTFLGRKAMRGTLSRRQIGIFGGLMALLWVIGLVRYSFNFPVYHNSIDFSLSGEYNHSSLSSYNSQNRNLTLELQRHGVFFPYNQGIHWMKPSQRPQEDRAGGYYLTLASEERYVIRRVGDEFEKEVMSVAEFPYKNDFFRIAGFKLNPGALVDNPDIKEHIVITDRVSQWRHLSFAIYWLYNRLADEYVPIQPPDTGKDQLQRERIDKLHFAEFSPSGDHIIFGFNHDLYIQDVQSREITQITNTGSPNVFNGKSDWVYEEEISASDKLFWWSPNEEQVVYASLDDTEVHDVTLDYIAKSPAEIDDTYQEVEEKLVEGVNQYPISKKIKYPKPGTPNPKVSLAYYSIKDKTTTKLELDSSNVGYDVLLYSAAWIDTDHFMIKLTDRTSKLLSKQVLKRLESSFTEIKFENVTKSYNGWVSKTQSPLIINSKSEYHGYVDVIIENSISRLAYFSTATSASPDKILTESFDWTLAEKSHLSYNEEEDVMYFLSHVRGSMDNHLVATHILGDNKMFVNITDTSKDGYYDADFSDDGKFLNLKYLGPMQPWQKVLKLENVLKDYNSEDNSLKEHDLRLTIESISPINFYDVTKQELDTTNLPTRLYKTIPLDRYADGSSVNINYIEILPPNFNPKHKYPLLVHAYGGPGLQTVDKKFKIDFQSVVSSQLNAVVLIIDPRGTGGQDWKFQTFATGKVGYWEPRDLTVVVSSYMAANKKFINPEKTALWGWSYGGFTTLKTLEIDGGNVFKYGMAVAPVTNWLFYDSVYTERYMNLPSENSNYTKLSRINDFDNFKLVNRFLIMHGTADDNVHLQNLLWLLDNFNQHIVENYDVQFFTDNDHSIYYHNSNTVVYDKLINWLQKAFTNRFYPY